MAKRTPPKAAKPKRVAQESAGPLGMVDESNIEQVEKETIDKVNRTLSTLEVAIASWDAAEKKPEDLRPKFMRYKKLHEALTEWERKMLTAIGKGEDLMSRVERLQEFVEICYAYA